MPLAHYDPESSSWRMSQGTLPWAAPQLLDRLPDWGMAHGGVLFGLPTPALLTAVRDCSSLPTPTASMATGAGTSGRDGGLNLQTAVSLLPTPRATDGTKGGPNQRGSSGDLMLPSALHLLPTPTCNDAKNSAGPSQVQRNTPALAMVTHLLPTPSVADGMGGHLSRSGDRGHELLLPGIAKQLAGASTPPPSAAGSPSSDDPHPPPPNQAATDPDCLPGLSSGSWGSRTVG